MKNSRRGHPLREGPEFKLGGEVFYSSTRVMRPSTSGETGEFSAM